MKVFLSWSGDRSKAVAELLAEWMKCVIQAVQPWVSSRDLDRGALWFTEISGQLSETGIGIVCLTQENKIKPWILFEAGALAKGLSQNRVCTFLVDLEPTDVQDPLAQFNHTLATRSSLHSLVRTLNNLLAEDRLDERILTRSFETYWPQFERDFDNVLKATPAQPSEKRSEESMLVEVLSTVRSLSARMRGVEAQVTQRATDIAGLGLDSAGSLASVSTGGLSLADASLPRRAPGLPVPAPRNPSSVPLPLLVPVPKPVPEPPRGMQAAARGLQGSEKA